MKHLARALPLLIALAVVGCGEPEPRRHSLSGSSPHEAAAKPPRTGLGAPPAERNALDKPPTFGFQGNSPRPAPVEAPTPQRANGGRLRLSPVTVKATPTGPSAPTGGWHMVFADGFGAEIGTTAGKDNFWYPNEAACCAATVNKHAERPNDLNAYNSSQVHVSAAGVELWNEYVPNSLPAEGSYPVRNYLSGAIVTDPQKESGGYHPFTWEPNGGETWAMECNCKLPENPEGGGFTNDGEDAAFWALDGPWHDETDFFEEWGWGSCKSASSCLTGFTWIYDTGNGTGGAKHSVETFHTLQSLNPSTTYHRYTIQIKPDNTWEVFIDGVRECGWTNQSSCTIKPPYAVSGKMYLNLTQAIAAQNESTKTPTTYPQFTSGKHVLSARSIQVWEDSPHSGANITGGGIAPGTVIEGEAPEGPGLRVGTKLRATTGTWTNKPTSFAYQWRRCNLAGASCANIVGATLASREVVSADVEHTLRVRVVASNAFGSATQESAATERIVP